MSRKGFTLLEVVLVVVILAILASITFGYLSFVQSTRISTTNSFLSTLGMEVATAVKLKGFPPATLEELIPRMSQARWIKDGKFVDAWERPIQYRVDGKKFELWSTGPDGISGTADDLRYERN
jgi:prepilin-type N-terminal cleavage/methylation domain-containing protein